jgi:hypothetical protein
MRDKALTGFVSSGATRRSSQRVGRHSNGRRETREFFWLERSKRRRCRRLRDGLQPTRSAEWARKLSVLPLKQVVDRDVAIMARREVGDLGQITFAEMLKRKSPEFPQIDQVSSG